MAEIRLPLQAELVLQYEPTNGEGQATAEVLLQALGRHAELQFAHIQAVFADPLLQQYWDGWCRQDDVKLVFKVQLGAADPDESLAAINECLVIHDGQVWLALDLEDRSDPRIAAFVKAAGVRDPSQTGSALRSLRNGFSSGEYDQQLFEKGRGLNLTRLNELMAADDAFVKVTLPGTEGFGSVRIGALQDLLATLKRKRVI